MFSFIDTTNPDAHDLGPNSWAERSAHVVQDMPSYAAVTSSSRAPAGVDAEMPLPNGDADGDLESDPGFVRDCGRMSAFERHQYHPKNIMPGRPLSAVFAVKLGEGYCSGSSKHRYTCTWY